MIFLANKIASKIYNQFLSIYVAIELFDPLGQGGGALILRQRHLQGGVPSFTRMHL